jgi:hypothetical protein
MAQLRIDLEFRRAARDIVAGRVLISFQRVPSPLVFRI